MALNDGVDPVKASKNTAKATADTAVGAPTVAAGANNGTSPPAPVVSGTATRGTITFGSGATPAAGAQVTVTFGGSLGGAPGAVLVSGSLGAYASGITASGFTVSTLNAPAASQANTTYSVSYLVVE